MFFFIPIIAVQLIYSVYALETGNEGGGQPRSPFYNTYNQTSE